MNYYKRPKEYRVKTIDRFVGSVKNDIYIDVINISGNIPDLVSTVYLSYKYNKGHIFNYYKNKKYKP